MPVADRLLSAASPVLPQVCACSEYLAIFACSLFDHPGIGRDTAILFAKAGTNVILTARRKDQLDKTKELCLQANKDVRVETIELDVSKPDQVKSLLDKIPDDLKEGMYTPHDVVS